MGIEPATFWSLVRSVASAGFSGIYNNIESTIICIFTCINTKMTGEKILVQGSNYLCSSNTKSQKSTISTG